MAAVAATHDCIGGWVISLYPGEPKGGSTQALPCPVCRPTKTIEQRLMACGVPPKEASYTADGLTSVGRRLLEELRASARKGEGAFIVGPNGREKTGAPVVLLREVLLGELEVGGATPGKAPTVRYVYVPQMVSRLRDLGRSGRDAIDRARAADGLTATTEEELLEDFGLSADLVLFDDLGAENLTDWTRSMVRLALWKRQTTGKAYIANTNLLLEKDPKRPEVPLFLDVYGSGVLSRLKESRIIVVPETVPDRRDERRRKGATS